jgi:hypothetical protein
LTWLYTWNLLSHAYSYLKITRFIAKLVFWFEKQFQNRCEKGYYSEIQFRFVVHIHIIALSLFVIMNRLQIQDQVFVDTSIFDMPMNFHRHRYLVCRMRIIGFFVRMTLL